jgi:hypothetical protein
MSRGIPLEVVVVAVDSVGIGVGGKVASFGPRVNMNDDGVILWTGFNT